MTSSETKAFSSTFLFYYSWNVRRDHKTSKDNTSIFRWRWHLTVAQFFSPHNIFSAFSFFVYYTVKPFILDIIFLCKCAPYIHISSHIWRFVAMWYIYLFKIHFHLKILAVKDSRAILKHPIPWPCEFKSQCCQISGHHHSLNSWASLSPVIWFDYLHSTISSPAHPFAVCRLSFAVNIMQVQQSAIIKIFSSGITSFCLVHPLLWISAYYCKMNNEDNISWL